MIIMRNGTIDRKGVAMEVERSERPPPYTSSPIPPPKPSPRPRVPRQLSLTPNADPHPRASVGQVHIFNQDRTSISGTFHIDPKVPSFGFVAKGCRARKKNPPHASFRTRHGAISLDLATTGNVNVVPKADILVGSRSGMIRINLLPTPVTSPRIGLEAFSRNGDIILFLPSTFSGVIHLTTRKGSLHLLSGLAAAMKVIKKTDKEALVSMGDNAVYGDTKHVDFCQLTSRSGKLIVGLTGQDSHAQVKSGFWATLFRSIVDPESTE